MKKIIITAIVIVTISIALFACGSSALDPEQGQTTNTESVSKTSVTESKTDTVNDAVSESVKSAEWEVAEGMHKIEAVQYAEKDPANEMTFYRAAEYKIVN